MCGVIDCAGTKEDFRNLPEKWKELHQKSEYHDTLVGRIVVNRAKIFLKGKAEKAFSYKDYCEQINILVINGKM